jgi:hypothetical protein
MVPMSTISYHPFVRIPPLQVIGRYSSTLHLSQHPEFVCFDLLKMKCEESDEKIVIIGWSGKQGIYRSEGYARHTISQTGLSIDSPVLSVRSKNDVLRFLTWRPSVMYSRSRTQCPNDIALPVPLRKSLHPWYGQHFKCCGMSPAMLSCRLQLQLAVLRAPQL